mmetsp:Transcript_52586/g.63396  ORF Transcript_52586/g.63396 Transcript_52586/m.63396 type:complete len:113 (-) Transcript_52586:557-895(-)
MEFDKKRTCRQNLPKSSLNPSDASGVMPHKQSIQFGEGRIPISEQLDTPLRSGLIGWPRCDYDDNITNTLQIRNHLHNNRNGFVVFINVDFVRGNLTPRNAALQQKLEQSLI